MVRVALLPSERAWGQLDGQGGRYDLQGAAVVNPPPSSEEKPLRDDAGAVIYEDKMD